MKTKSPRSSAMTAHTSSVADGPSDPPESVAHPLLSRLIHIGDGDETCVVPINHCMNVVKAYSMF